MNPCVSVCSLSVCSVSVCSVNVMFKRYNSLIAYLMLFVSIINSCYLFIFMRFSVSLMQQVYESLQQQRGSSCAPELQQGRSAFAAGLNAWPGRR